MNKSELNEARTNPDFLKYLEETRVDAIKSKDIMALYEVLDSLLVLDLEEEKINSVYENILKISFENVEKIINENRRLDLENENLFYVRAFYEYAVEKWSYNDFKGAKELIFVLLNILEDEELNDSFKVHIVALSKENELDSFYENEVDLNFESGDEKYGYFITNFNFDKKSFIKENEEILKKEYKNLKHLLEA
ncbi:MAG: hypothetical protein ACNI25_00095 [Halarcobacter sp.]